MQMTTNNIPTTEPHVAVLAFPFSTHAAPLLAIIRHLAAAAPTVHFSFFNTRNSNKSIFSTTSKYIAPNITAQEVLDGVPENYVFTGKPQEDIELFMKVAPENFRQEVEAAVADTGRKVTCLVTDAFFWFAAEMAEELCVPWVPFWTAGPSSLSTHVYTDFIRDTIGIGGIKGREDESLKFIPGMSKLRIRDLPEGVVFGNIDSLFSQMLHKMGQMLPRAAAVFINSFEELDLTITDDLKSKFNKFLNVGPFNLLSAPPPPLSDDGCLSWLDKQRAESVAYISFGSVTIPPQNELVGLAEALEASGVAFLWSLRDTVKTNLPKGFLERTRVKGMVVPWAPQLQVLAHNAVGVFITHCGWNSLLESVAFGVPLICRPFFGDQRLNARMVEEVLEIGLKVEGGVFTKNGMLNYLDMMLSQEKGKNMREKIRGLKQVAEIAVGPEGSSTNNFKILLDLVVSRPN